MKLPKSAIGRASRHTVALVQESLEGTQADANELLEEAALGFMNPRHDEDHEQRAFGCVVFSVSQATLLGWPYNAWASSVKVASFPQHRTTSAAKHAVTAALTIAPRFSQLHLASAYQFLHKSTTHDCL